MALPARAQIDPEPRKLVQFGYNQSIEGRGPVAAYAFFYWNTPGFLQDTNLTLRLAIAPVYLDSELGISGALGANTDIGIGLAGGGFADSYQEIRQGQYLRGESFTGHGGEASLSLYHRFNPNQQIPLNFIARGLVHYSTYAADDSTAPGFVLPVDHTSAGIRTGLRLGGREPLIFPSLALELSAWYEVQWRNEHGLYGFANDRDLHHHAQLAWARALFIYTLPELKHNFSVSFTAGTSVQADRFSAYRLGSALPMASEFPLNLPGYYYQEITARRFFLMGGQYLLPLDKEDRWSLNFSAGSAWVDYLPGFRQPGSWLSGAGGGVVYRSESGIWQASLGYAYGIDAIRSHGRGANSIGLIVQWDLERQLKKSSLHDPTGILDRLRGLPGIFGR